MDINSNAVLLLIMAAVLNGVPLLYGTLGEILSEKAGNLNLGVEGMMFMGGAMGLGAAFYFEAAGGTNGILAVILALFFSFLGGAIGALIYSFLTITLRANQNVTGLALAIFGTGAGQFIGEYMRVTSGGYVAVSNSLKAVFLNSPFPAAIQQLPVVGPLLFGHSIFLYLGLVLTKGSLKGYSVQRNLAAESNDRGAFLLHPENLHIRPGECVQVEWELFWFEDRSDFRKKVLNYPAVDQSFQFIRVAVFCFGV